MKTIEVDDATYRALELAAHLTGGTPGSVVETLVANASAPRPTPAPVADTDKCPIYADYNGERFRGLFDSTTKSIRLTSGKLAGGRYKSPSAAARAVVESERPDVDSNRNGWTFWTLDDGTGRQLQSLR